MAYDNEILNDIFDKTDGYCHICDGRLTFSAYADVYHRQGWEVDHSVPRAKGGTDHLNNLWPAHTSCNRSKGAFSTQSARNWYGRSRYRSEKPVDFLKIFGWLLLLGIAIKFIGTKVNEESQVEK